MWYPSSWHCAGVSLGLPGRSLVLLTPVYSLVDTPLFRGHPGAQNHVDLSKDFLLPPEEVVKAMLALLTEKKYAGGTILEVGDIGSWREVHILGDVGPQGRSTLARAKTADATARLSRMLLGERADPTATPRL